MKLALFMLAVLALFASPAAGVLGVDFSKEICESIGLSNLQLRQQAVLSLI